MDNKIFSREIIGKEVETITGRTVGKLEDLVIDTVDGSIKYLLVSASGKVIGEEHKVDDKGRLVVETDRIRFDGNKIIIN
ncbi:PRC-barrel domain-containing protein [Candidatus Methanoplasma termitum]|nr:PRC-barrel domain-containing protein [Candidatus Methanoplasma termitum]MCL2334353.1 PRC-barrel domain-containing protein [Candidatus Methanoplasma sp.]